MASERDQARERVRAATRIAALTGAGVSAESGIPTFRGPGGLFEEHRPEELATPEAFAADPARVWRFYRWRQGIVRSAEPNPGHRALGALDRSGRLRLITQNVDGLHQRGGVADPIELHGNLLRARCVSCAARTMEVDEAAPVPPCPSCGAALRPDVVWFGESLPPVEIQRAAAAAEEAEVFLVVGTSALVYPAAGFAVAALRRGCPVIEVNPEPTPLSDQVDHRLAGPSGEILPWLLAPDGD